MRVNFTTLINFPDCNDRELDMVLLFTALLFFPLLSFAQETQYVLAGRDIVVPKLGSQELLTAHPRFEGFIQQMFNRPGYFHGPNCYNTALISSGIMSKKSVRYVSPEEFEAILKANFVRVSSPEYRDIVVFDANGSRGHAAFYLGDNLIFHKKSHGIKYHYRITTIEKAGVVEENEWIPGPFDDLSDQMKWPELGSLPRAHYRIQSKTLPTLDKRLDRIVSRIEAKLVVDLKTWAIGKKWGMVGEYLLQDLVKYAESLNTDNYTRGILISLNDQIFTMIEEVYFKSSRRSPESVMKEICLPAEKEQLFGLIKELGKLLMKNDESIQGVLEQLEAQDRSTCRLRPMALLLN